MFARTRVPLAIGVASAAVPFGSASDAGGAGNCSPVGVTARAGAVSRTAASSHSASTPSPLVTHPTYARLVRGGGPFSDLCPLGPDTLQQRVPASADHRDVERAGLPERGGRQPPPPLLVADQLRHGARQRGDVAVRHEQTVDPVVD